MIYNPIFEEEKEKKIQFKQLKHEIKKRAREETVSELMNRVYNLLKRKPILTITHLLNPLINVFKFSKEEEESAVSKT